tara:strand:- start:252 stop:512 length:261 start_codon:yes stop_codon:yes gene_type:complete
MKDYKDYTAEQLAKGNSTRPFWRTFLRYLMDEVGLTKREALRAWFLYYDACQGWEAHVNPDREDILSAVKIAKEEILAAVKTEEVK